MYKNKRREMSIEGCGKMTEKFAKATETIFNQLEKIFRYILPGYTFILLLALFLPLNKNLLLGTIGNSKYYYIYLPLIIGPIIYLMHRLLFEFVDYVCYGFDFDKIAEIYKLNQKMDGKLRGNFYYRLAITHFCAILSELLIIFSICRCYSCINYSKDSIIVKVLPPSLVLTIGVILFFASIIDYCFMHEIQEKIRNNIKRVEKFKGLIKVKVAYQRMNYNDALEAAKTEDPQGYENFLEELNDIPISFFWK